MDNNSSRTKKTIVNAAATIFNRTCFTLLNFGLRSVFIFTLGIQYAGVSSVFSDILTMLSLSELGIGAAIATALYVPLKEKDEEKIRKLMLFYKQAYRVIAVAIFLIGLMLLPILDKLIKDVPDISESLHVIFIFYILKTSLSYLLIYKTTLLNADQKQYKVKGIETACLIVRYIIEAICLVIFKQFLLYLVIEVVATVIQNIIVTRRADKEYPYAFVKSEEKLSKTETKKLFKDIKALTMYRVSATVGNSIDTILVSSVISTTIVGLLSNYTLIRKQIEVLVKQVFTSLTPSVGNLVAEGDSNKQFKVFNKVFYMSFVFVNCCAVCLFVLFNPFIELWLGKEYLLSLDIAFIIAFDFFLYILLQAIASFRTANGLFVKGQYRPIATAIINLILSIIFIKKYGIFGTFLATVISRLVTQWYDPYILHKYTYKASFQKFYLRYIMYIMIFVSDCILTYYIAKQFVFESIFLTLVCRLICCMIIPNLWVILWTFYLTEFKDTIKTFKRK